MNARTAAVIAVAFASAVLAVCLRVIVSCQDDIETADAAIASSMEDTAIETYGRAARWYLPFSPCHARARRQLLQMGRMAEAQGRDDIALKAYRELRGAVLGTRWLITPDHDLLDEADIAIARLMHRQDLAQRGEAALSEEKHLELLRRDSSPNPWLSAIAVLLFFAWVVVLGSGAWRGILPDGTIRWKVVGLHSLATILLLFLWLLALRFT